jgi:glycosyltransferase involved in cell wall biosynthesis
MRILLSVHHHLDRNAGAPGVTLELGEHYRALGHQVSFISFDDLPGWVPGPAAELLFPEAAVALLLRRAKGVDVIDATTGDTWLWARLRRAERPKLVTRSHGLEHVYWQSAVEEARAAGQTLAARTRRYHGGWRLREVALSLRSSDACVFTNSHDLEFAVRHLGVRRDKATVVLNGIPDYLRNLPLAPPDEGITVAVIGTWAPRKGARYAAAAVGAVMERHPSVSALLVGTQDPAHEVLASFSPSVRDRIRVVPRFERPELPGLLQGAHVLLSASLAEGFSVAVPEGMAAGLAPVATAIPGTREIVRDGVNGLLVPPRDSAALARGVERLLEDPALLQRVRVAAHADAQSLGWPDIARQNLDVYERVLSPMSRP